LWPPEQRLIYPDSDLDQDVKIGANCWIALGCVILPGSTIGDNSVVGARSVVSGEIPPNSLAIGSPAKVIRRLDEEQSERK
jgi:acetyltransferase-like isoleucine patch superfamily enzyme